MCGKAPACLLYAVLLLRLSFAVLLRGRSIPQALCAASQYRHCQLPIPEAVPPQTWLGAALSILLRAGGDAGGLSARASPTFWVIHGLTIFTV